MLPRRRKTFLGLAAVIVVFLYCALRNSWDAEQQQWSPSAPAAPAAPVAVENPSWKEDKVVEPKPNVAAQKADGKHAGDLDPATTEAPRPSTPEPQVVKTSSVGLTSGSDALEDSQKPVSHALNPARPSPTKQHWVKPTEHFPLPVESIITLPTNSARKMPKIQHVFPSEAEGPKRERLLRQSKVKKEILRAWSGYKEFAWMHDELKPATGGFRDPFAGWAATLVDSLDTLWIAGLKDEFDEAAKATKDIDFTHTTRFDIQVFETTIRYLGGLIAAYDVSGGADGDYAILLDKAVELAEILMGIFDTPNRMPIMYYNWQPEITSQPHKAGKAGFAELATLSLEFTRLAQLTGQNKYYDAVDRITNELVGLQERGTLVPGLFPENLDISGCSTAVQTRSRSKSVKVGVSHLDAKRGVHGPFDCVPQPNITPGRSGYQQFHVGGSQDSGYEYFGKEYQLLGGREQKYQKLYEDTIDGINKHLLFRPMVQGDWDILFPGRVGLSDSSSSSPDMEYPVTHLTCFVGGMYALGGKLFGRKEDVEYAEKLTNGCVWAYQSTATGVMPEGGHVVPCPNLEKCSFNESLWWQKLDPQYATRDSKVRDWERAEAERERLELEAGMVSDDLSSQDSIQQASSAEEYHSGSNTANIPDARLHHAQRSSQKPLTHEQYTKQQLKSGIPPGYSRVTSPNYILRPEAIESVWYMYRITGDPSWMDKGWTMFEATMQATRAPYAHSAVSNVLIRDGPLTDSMESFWLAETLKYYYLLFSDPDVISLDEWVLNTEAHPFKLSS